MLLLHAIVLVLVAVAEATTENEHGARQRTGKRSHDLDDLLFTDGQSFGTSSRSKLECAVICQSNQCCAAVTFCKSSAECQVHSCLPRPQGVNSPCAGSRTSFFAVRSGVSAQNLALHKPTRQSSTYPPEYGNYYTSDKAVDGGSYFFAHTANGQSPAYWIVDLESNVEIHAVKVTHRVDCCFEELGDFDVEIFCHDPVDNPSAQALLCYHYTGSMPAGATETLNCAQPTCGRYLRIQKPTERLVLVEVEVLGYQYLAY